MTFTDFIEAGHNLSEIGAWISGKHGEFLSSSVISTLWEKVEVLIPAALIGVIFILLSLVQTFFGTRLFRFEKYAFFAYVGFLLGEYFLISLFPLQILGWVFGLIVGVAFAIAAKQLYYIVYAFCAGYAAYVVLYGGYYLPEALTSITKGDLMISLAGALVVAIIAMLLHRVVEFVGVTALGSWCVVLSVNYLLDALLGRSLAGFMEIILFAILTVAGVIVQKFVLPEENEIR